MTKALQTPTGSFLATLVLHVLLVLGVLKRAPVKAVLKSDHWEECA